MKKFSILSKRPISKGLFMLSFCGLFGFSNAQNWLWADSYGGNQSDKAIDVVSDINGNVYAVGTFGSPTINFGDIQLVNQGNTDFYFVKFDS